MEVYTNGGVGGTTQLNVTSFAGAGTITNTSVLNLRIQGAGGGMVDNSISAQYNSSGVGTYSLAFKPFGTTAMTILGTGNVGIGVTNPQSTLHVQGGTLVTNPTVFNTVVAGWFIIGYWDCSAAQNTGAHLKLRIMGCNGYDNTGGTPNQMGGETTIYLNNLNNLNTTTNANVEGLWKHEGGLAPFTSVKAVQGSSRYQYFIYALVQSYTQHSITAETTQGTIWTSQFTTTSDPGANSLTVRVLTLSTAAVGSNVGIGTAAPRAPLHVYDALGVSLSNAATVNYTQSAILGFNFGGGTGVGTRDSFRILSQTVNRDNGAGPIFFDYGAQADLVFQRKTNNLYSGGANDTTYTEVMRLGGATGFVGIGITNPDVKLHVMETAINADVSRKEMFRGLRYGTGGVQNSVSMGFALGANTTFINPFGCLDIKLNGFPGISNNYGSIPDITVMSVIGNGNVGIGITTPITPLHVNGSTYIQGPTMGTTTSNVVGNFGLRICQLTSGQNTTGQIVGQLCFHGFNRPNASSFIRSITEPSNGFDDAGALAFGTSNSGTGAVEMMRISQTGFVGIGITNPNERLHTYQSPTNIIRLQTSSVDNAYIVATNDLLFISANYSSTGTRENTGRGSAQIVLSQPTAGGIITFNTSPAINTLVQERMRITSDGRVGINITNPSVPLHVNGSATVNLGGGGFYFSTGTSIIGWPGNASLATSIRATDAIVTGASFIAASDIRVKKNIQPVHNSLQIIDQLNIVSYDKIDYLGTGVEAGIIAQDIQGILPRAISKNTSFIPNIYQRATYEDINDDEICVHVICNDKDVKEGGRVQLKIVKGDKEETYENSLYQLTGTSFIIKKWSDFSNDHKVFVYGTEVDDFLSVDKEQIGMLAAAAVKELHKTVSVHESTIAFLQSQNEALQSQLTSLLASHTSLLAWAQSQGF
jgi:hypothetical protein